MSLKAANMKGKNVFTQNEITEIVALIRERCSADRGKQKQIRAKMRRIGFYGQDDFGISDMTEEKFYRLIESEKIIISDGSTAKVSPVTSKREEISLTPNNLKQGLEVWCGEDPYVVILGTFPSEKSLVTQSYYQNKSKNSFYKIMEILFARPSGMSDKEFIISNHIALWDCMKEADREGSLDANIKKYVPNDILTFLSSHPTISTIVLNGTGDTTSTFELHFPTEKLKRKYRIISLPSTSNSRPMSFEDKLEGWQIIREIIDAKS